jgi:KaiC/GvpD/RAD55 family RecA-like ATPase
MPLIEDLTTRPIPPGSNLLVEFDPASQWYNAALTIAAGWIKTGGSVLYATYARSSDDVRSQLKRFGLDVDLLRREQRLMMTDWYTPTLGKKSEEAPPSLKVADLSIWVSRDIMGQQPQWANPQVLRIHDNMSTLARFNEEKAWVEFELSRALAVAPLRKMTRLGGLVSGVHSDWVYKTLEAAVDGIIDFKVEDTGQERRDVMGIRMMRNVDFDRRWYTLKTGNNLEVILGK